MNCNNQPWSCHPEPFASLRVTSEGGGDWAVFPVLGVKTLYRARVGETYIRSFQEAATPHHIKYQGDRTPANRHQPKKQPITIRRGEGGGAARGGPLWSPALRVVQPCGGYKQGTTGDHKGPLHLPTPRSPLRITWPAAILLGFSMPSL